MSVEKVTNQPTNSITDVKRLMTENEKRTVSEAKYQSNLRRQHSNKITLSQTEKPIKEPYVVVKGFDVDTGKMIAEDKNNGITFPARILSDGPLAVGSRVLGFPPQNGGVEGAIRGPMKGPPIPPLEIPKKPKKKKEKEPDQLQYILNVYFVAGN